MKLFNNFSDESLDKPSTTVDRLTPRDDPRLRTIAGNPRVWPPLPGDPLRFDMIDDELEESDSALGDAADHEADYENVDVQAILFYGYTGRRCFPCVQAL